MNINNKKEEIIDNSIYDSYVGVRFNNTTRTYYFGVKDLELKLGDKVVVETARGQELAEVSYAQKDIDEYKSELGLKPILRIANKEDEVAFNTNLKLAEASLAVCRSEAKNLKLPMNLISAEYTLDRAKVIFCYLADERVDFRELLKVLAYKLHTRIELRQLGSRDKSKLVGGIGVCGLPLCCSTFLNEFDGISVNRAKNQMLAINIPKLSGHCGKLLCCLKYEDEAYVEAKKDMPELGSKCFVDKKEYTVGAINVISKTIRLDGDEDIINYTLEEFKANAKVSKKNEQHFNHNHNEKK